MAAENEIPEEVLDSKGSRPQNEFPGSTFPNVFADGVVAYARGKGVVKFYLYRSDPNLFGRGGAVNNPFAQVVMPSSGFAAMTVFFQRALRQLIAVGEITEAEVKKLTDDVEAANQERS